MNDHKETKMMKIVAAVPRKRGEAADNTRSFWTKIGVAFLNKDASWNLRFDFLPTSPDTTIQLREFDPKHDAASE